MFKRNKRSSLLLSKGFVVAASLGLSALSATCLASDWRTKCDSELAHVKANHKWLKVIVKLDSASTDEQTHAFNNLGIDVYRHLPIVQSLAANVRADKLQQLANLPWVQALATDETVRKNDAYAVDSSRAGVASAQFGLTGRGVTIAVLDSGVQDGPDFSGPSGSRLLAMTSMVAGTDGSDDCGHGTSVAGLIAGNGRCSTGGQFKQTFMGIAPGASLVSVKVIDRTGQGTVSQVIAGIQWCINNQAAYGIRAINLSLGHDCKQSYLDDPLCQACEMAHNYGLAVVCAAGNDGRTYKQQNANRDNNGYGTNYGSIQSPANDPFVITVGAMKSVDGNRANDQIATYSSRGPSTHDFILKPDLVAAGNQLASVEAHGSFLAGAYQQTNGVPYSSYMVNGDSSPSGDYCTLSGTSMAAPVVCGAIALMLEADSTLNADTLKLRLMLSADKWLDAFGNGDACTYGAGYLNVMSALQDKTVATQPVNSPQVSRSIDGTVDITGSRALWGNIGGGTIYGNRALWGNTLGNSRALWGNTFWNAGSVSGYKSVSIDLSSGSVVITGE